MHPPEATTPWAPIALTGFGLVSAVGEDAASAAASIEAGLAGMSTLRIPDRGGNELIGCPAIEVDVPHGHMRRLWDFAQHAASQALEQAGLAAVERSQLDCHLLWTVPHNERPGYRIEPRGQLLDEFAKSLGFRSVRSQALAAGQAGAVAAVQMASRVLLARPRTICLLGSADTLIQLRVLRWLQRGDRLKTEIWPDGLIPGEGGAFVCFESLEGARAREGRALCLVESAAYAVGAAADLPGGNARAEDLSLALRAALPASHAVRSIERIYIDLNGESLRALEWGLASVRVLEPAGVDADLVHPADCVGDVGAVSCVMHLGLAAIYLCSAAAAARVMVVAASDSGERGAVTLVRPAGGAASPAGPRSIATMAYEGLLAQSFDEVGFLWSLRCHRLAAPDATLREFGLLDARLGAHLRAMVLGGKTANSAFRDMAGDAAEQMFVRVSLALWAPRVDAAALHALVAASARDPALWSAIADALGFAEPRSLVGVIQTWLVDEEPAIRALALRASALHGANPGRAIEAALESANAALRSVGLRCAGELARTELAPACIAALEDVDVVCRFWAARSALLLGERSRAARALLELADLPDPEGGRALQLAISVLSVDEAGVLLKRLSQAPERSRRLVEAVGWAGDPQWVPWLIGTMSHPALARAAGSSFSLITGVNLDRAGLTGAPPAQAVDAGPGDDAGRDDVAMDPDEGLAWPDPGKTAAWWQAEGSRFVPGTRYFMGDLPTLAHCLAVLATGFQRQRIAAAQYLALVQQGVTFFNTAAPAWRQRHQLELAQSS